MEPTTVKPNLLGNVLVRIFSFGVLIFVARFAYVITVKGNSCDSGNFCFFPSAVPHTLNLSSDVGGDSRLRNYSSSVFQDLIADGYLSPDSKSLCIGTLASEDIASLKQMGVADSVGISGRSFSQPFKDNTFDFEFSGEASIDRSPEPAKFAAEVSRTLKSGGFFVVHTAARDDYSLNSLLELFNSCRLIRYREINGLDSSIPSIREIILIKDNETRNQSLNGNFDNKCSVPGYKRELIKWAEPFISEEPLKPWITLKRNRKKITYLPSMVDISFKNRYVYIDVGARNYGSSIGSWFRKVYPKQNKSFEIYAIEADKAFHKEYRMKKRVTLLPYVAWVRNETLFFEIGREPRRKNEERGRIQAVQSSSNFVGGLDKIRGFDFADWMKRTISERDFVVVKMDAEGTEFHLVTRLVESGAICLIDEMFLECHYNRWQNCCNGERSSKYQKTYAQCLELFSFLRESGVLVHQWC